MNTTVCEFVTGTPKAQPRPRAFARGGKARVYDPGTAEGWKSAIAIAFREHKGKFPEGRLACSINLRFSRPKSHYGTGKNRHILKHASPVHHLQKPDVDNCAKAILDALAEKSGIGVFKDDTQVTKLVVTKEWAMDCDMQPGAQINITKY